MHEPGIEPVPSDVLLELVRQAVESGLDILRKNPRLMPMAIIHSGGKHGLIAFDGVGEAEIESTLRDRLNTAIPRPEAYVLRYGGELINDAGNTVDAVVVEGATPEMTQALQWACPLGTPSQEEILLLGRCKSYYPSGG